ncbi:MAG: long-chain-fatty-acid--CoA ligase [Desulfobacteraceae bacterium]|nr:long-chain-fatty-acid--CoA ligase [Desulfobacteraceae bacterium]
MSMGDIIRRSAHKFPKKTAFIFGDQRLTYQELNRRVNRLANGLLDMGLKKGDRVAVILHNCPEFFEIYFASAKIGGIFVPINNLLKETELRQILEYVTPRFLFLDPDYEQIINSIEGELTFIEFLIGLEGSSLSSLSQYEALIDQGEPEEPEVSVFEDDIMSIFLTSGTTGLPKGAMRTHRHDFINAMTGTIEFKVGYDDRALLLFPFYHVTFEDNLRHILMGNTIVIRREGNFDPQEVLEILSREKITMCQFVPTMISSMIEGGNIDAYDLRHFRLLLYAASPIPVELLKKAMKRFKCQFVQMYGQTETGPLTTVLAPEDHVLEASEAKMARLASAGRPFLNYEVRIVDKDGNDVAVGEVGEIIVRGEAMTVGYWNLPEETARTIKDGWLYTGDMGRFDDQGYVFIVDRRHDMIISGGKNIYPREIEEVLDSHEAILESAVIGVPDEHWVESVKAIVVLKEGMEVSGKEIIAFCKEHLASYKKPKSLEFWKELPKSLQGKIVKKAIRERYWKGTGRMV